MAFNEPPLMEACRTGNVSAVPPILTSYTWASDADRDVLKDREGRTALDLAQHPRMYALLRKHFTIVVRKCVIGGNAEHPSRNRMKHLAPRMASFLI